jgi:hypothetical protein
LRPPFRPLSTLAARVTVINDFELMLAEPATGSALTVDYDRGEVVHPELTRVTLGLRLAVLLRDRALNVDGVAMTTSFRAL